MTEFQTGLLYIGSISAIVSGFVVLALFWRRLCPSCKAALMDKMKIDVNKTIKHCPRCCYSEWD